MESKSLENRVTFLENEMQELRGLPDRVASLEVNVLQFRAEVRGEFSSMRADMGEMRQDIADMEAIANRTDAPTFDNTILAMERSGILLTRVTNVFDALTATAANRTTKSHRGLSAPSPSLAITG